MNVASLTDSKTCHAIRCFYLLATGQAMDFSGYSHGLAYDEMFAGGGNPWPRAEALFQRLQSLSPAELQRHQMAADVTLWNMGITFNVYGHDAGLEKVWPFDILPRIVSGEEWSRVERGLKQRIQALNLFVDDIYNDRKICRDGVVPEELIATAKTYRPACEGFHPPRGVWCHVTGTDLVRDRDGEFYVLEDNLRCPSGVSYVLENREVMKRTFPQVFDGLRVTPIEDYAERLLDTLLHTAPRGIDTPTVALLTPGIYNSAYFEHSFLAQQMGVELVEGRDLVADDGLVYMRTTKGLKRIDVLYRRIDDDFLDPCCFQPESLLGVPHLMDAYRQGGITLANAPGTGIADDKAVYAYVPQIIKYYLC